MLETPLYDPPAHSATDSSFEFPKASQVFSLKLDRNEEIVFSFLVENAVITDKKTEKVTVTTILFAHAIIM